MSNKFTVELPVEFSVDYNTDGNITCRVSYNDLEDKIKEYIISALENYNNTSKNIKDNTENEDLEEYDENGNLIHTKDSDGYESWREYDKDGDKIHFKDPDRYEIWKRI